MSLKALADFECAGKILVVFVGFVEVDVDAEKYFQKTICFDVDSGVAVEFEIQALGGYVDSFYKSGDVLVIVVVVVDDDAAAAAVVVSVVDVAFEALGDSIC